MAGTNGQSALDLKAELLAGGRSFSFFQAVRLLNYLRRHAKQDAGEDAQGAEAPGVRVRPELSLGFPASDVARIDELPSGAGYVVTATFLGLYGTSSPLPTFYTEDLFKDAREDSTAVRDFLDIIHRRLFQLLFESWNKYRLFIQVAENKNQDHLGMLYAIAGIASASIAGEELSSYALLRYTGLFGGHPRSALALKTILADLLNGPEVEIISCVPRAVKIRPDQRFRLGSDETPLGRNSFIGEELIDTQGKFRVRIGPLTQRRFRALLPGAEEEQKLSKMVRRFLVDPLVYDFELVLAEGETQPARLGVSEGSWLGLDTVLFTGAFQGQLGVIFPP